MIQRLISPKQNIGQLTSCKDRREVNRLLVVHGWRIRKYEENL